MVTPRTIGRERTSLARTRPPVLLVVVLLAAAFPYRTPISIPLAHSISLLDVAAGGCVVALYLRVQRSPTVRILRPKVTIYLLVPVGIAALSLFWSTSPSATAKAVISYAEGFVVFLYASTAVASMTATAGLRWLRIFAIAFLIGPLLMLAHVPGFKPQTTVSPTSGDYIGYYTRLSHPFIGRSNNLAVVLAFFVVPLLAVGAIYKSRRTRLMGLLVLAAVAATISRGVILALVLLLFASLPRNRLRLKIGRLALVGALGITTIYLADPVTRQYFSERSSGSNIAVRFSIVKQTISGITQRPLEGFGAAVVPGANDSARVSEACLNSATIAQETHIGDTTQECVPAYAHNAYVQQWLFYGIPLGSLVIFCLVGVAREFFRRARRLGGRQSARLNYAVGLAIVGQLLIFVTEDSFEGTVLRVIFYLSVGYAAGWLDALEREELTLVSRAEPDFAAVSAVEPDATYASRRFS